MILQEDKIRLKYPNAFIRDLSLVSEVVYHSTAGFSDYEKFIEWVLSGERDREYQNNIGLFHFVIEPNGGIHQIFDYKNWFYHSSSGKHDRRTIGIECMNPSPQNDVELTNEQYASLIDLTFNEIFSKFKISYIVGHSMNGLIYSNVYKNTPYCPGKVFKWSLIENELLSRKINYVKYLKGERFIILPNEK